MSAPSCGIKCPDPKTSKVCANCEHRAVAKRLKKVSDNMLHVIYSPTCQNDDDEASRGHLYHVFLNSRHEEDSIYLDDRGPEPMEFQLIAELRRIASIYSDLAEEVKLNSSDAPVYRVEIMKDGEVIEQLHRTEDKSLAEGIVTSFNEASTSNKKRGCGPKLEAKLCIEEKEPHIPLVAAS